MDWWMGNWLVGGVLLVVAPLAWKWKFGPSVLSQDWAAAAVHCAQQCQAGNADRAWCKQGGPSGTQLEKMECVSASVSRMLMHRSMLWLCIILVVAWLAPKLLHQAQQWSDASVRVRGQHAGLQQLPEQEQQENMSGGVLRSHCPHGEEEQRQQVGSSVRGAFCYISGMARLCCAQLKGSRIWTSSRLGCWLKEMCEGVLSSGALPGLLAALIGACHIILGLWSGMRLLFLVIEVCAVSSLTYCLASRHTTRCVRAIANEAAVRLVALHRQNEELADEKEELEAELQAVALNPQPTLHAGSPADLILEVLDLMLEGGSPQANDLLVLRDFILNGGQHHDMYQPLDVWQHLHTPGMEPDVEAALFQQLGFSMPPRRMPGWTAQDGVYSLYPELQTRQRKSGGTSSSQLLAPEDASNSEDRPDTNCMPEGGPSSDSYLMSMLATLAYDSSSLEQTEGRALSRSASSKRLSRGWMRQQSPQMPQGLEAAADTGLVKVGPPSTACTALPPSNAVTLSGHHAHPAGRKSMSASSTLHGSQEFALWPNASQGSNALAFQTGEGSRQPPPHAYSSRSSRSELRSQVPEFLDARSAPNFPRFGSSAPTPSSLLHSDSTAQNVAEESGHSSPLPYDPYANLQQQQQQQQQQQWHKTRLQRLSEYIRTGARPSGVARFGGPPYTPEIPYAPGKSPDLTSRISSSMGRSSFSDGNLRGLPHQQQQQQQQQQQPRHSRSHTTVLEPTQLQAAKEELSTTACPASQRAAWQHAPVQTQGAPSFTSEDLLSGSVALGLLNSAARPKSLRGISPLERATSAPSAQHAQHAPVEHLTHTEGIEPSGEKRFMPQCLLRLSMHSMPPQSAIEHQHTEGMGRSEESKIVTQRRLRRSVHSTPHQSAIEHLHTEGMGRSEEGRFASQRHLRRSVHIMAPQSAARTSAMAKPHAQGSSKSRPLQPLRPEPRKSISLRHLGQPSLHPQEQNPTCFPGTVAAQHDFPLQEDGNNCWQPLLAIGGDGVGPSLSAAPIAAAGHPCRPVLLRTSATTPPKEESVSRDLLTALQMPQRSSPLTEAENEAANILFSMSSTGFAQQSKQFEPRRSVACDPFEVQASDLSGTSMVLKALRSSQPTPGRLSSSYLGSTPQGPQGKLPLGAAPITIGTNKAELTPQPEARSTRHSSAAAPCTPSPPVPSIPGHSPPSDTLLDVQAPTLGGEEGHGNEGGAGLVCAPSGSQSMPTSLPRPAMLRTPSQHAKHARHTVQAAEGNGSLSMPSSLSKPGMLQHYTQQQQQEQQQQQQLSPPYSRHTSLPEQAQQQQQQQQQGTRQSCVGFEVAPHAGSKKSSEHKAVRFHGACSSAPGSVQAGSELDRGSSAFQGSSQTSEATLLGVPRSRPACGRPVSVPNVVHAVHGAEAEGSAEGKLGARSSAPQQRTPAAFAADTEDASLTAASSRGGLKTSKSAKLWVKGLFDGSSLGKRPGPSRAASAGQLKAESSSGKLSRLQSLFGKSKGHKKKAEAAQEQQQQQRDQQEKQHQHKALRKSSTGSDTKQTILLPAVDEEAVRPASKRGDFRGVSRVDLRSCSAADYSGQHMGVGEDTQASLMAATQGGRGDVHLPKMAPELRQGPDAPDVTYSSKPRGVEVGLLEDFGAQSPESVMGTSKEQHAVHRRRVSSAINYARSSLPDENRSSAPRSSLQSDLMVSGSFRSRRSLQSSATNPSVHALGSCYGMGSYHGSLAMGMELPQVPEGLDASNPSDHTTTTTSSNSRSQTPVGNSTSNAASTEATLRQTPSLTTEATLRNTPSLASIVATAATHDHSTGARFTGPPISAGHDAVADPILCTTTTTLPFASRTAASNFGADGLQIHSQESAPPPSPFPITATAGAAVPDAHTAGKQSAPLPTPFPIAAMAGAVVSDAHTTGKRSAPLPTPFPIAAMASAAVPDAHITRKQSAPLPAPLPIAALAAGAFPDVHTTGKQSAPLLGPLSNPALAGAAIPEGEAEASRNRKCAGPADRAETESGAEELGPATARDTATPPFHRASPPFDPASQSNPSTSFLMHQARTLLKNTSGGSNSSHHSGSQEVRRRDEMGRGVDLQGSELSRGPSPRPPPMLEMDRILGVAYDSFSFDAFELAAVTQGHPLSTLAYYLFHKSNLISSFSLHTVKLARFLRGVEAGYCSTNPYHNATHAADVLQTLHVIMHRGAMVPHFADRLSAMAALLAAIMHDVEHMGLTNDFLVNSSSALAIRYNDHAPLENHHLASGFTVLNAPDHNFLSNLPKADYIRLRKIVIDLVLATDMKQHFALVGQFKALVRRVTPKAKSAAAPSQKSRAHSRALTSTLSVLLDSSSARTPNASVAECTISLPKRASLDESLARMAGTPAVHPSSPLSQSPSRLETSRSLSRLIHAPSPLDSPSQQQQSHLHPRMSLPQRMSLDAKPSVAAEQLQAAVREASLAACSLSFARTSRASEHNQGVAHGAPALKLSMSSNSHRTSSNPAAAGGPGGSYSGTGSAPLAVRSSSVSALAASREGLHSSSAAGHDPQHTGGERCSARHSKDHSSSASKNSHVNSSVDNSMCSSGHSNKISDHSSEHCRESAHRAKPGKEGDPASLDDSQKLLLLQIALKCADLGHVAEDHDVHIRWVHALEEEFYRQGDREKAAKLPVSPLFDRDKPGVTKSQVGFFDVVVLPLFQALTVLLPGVQPLLDSVEANSCFWKAEQQQQQQQHQQQQQQQHA